jgi:hypothetical protein
VDTFVEAFGKLGYKNATTENLRLAIKKLPSMRLLLGASSTWLDSMRLARAGSAKWANWKIYYIRDWVISKEIPLRWLLDMARSLRFSSETG